MADIRCLSSPPRVAGVVALGVSLSRFGCGGGDNAEPVLDRYREAVERELDQETVAFQVRVLAGGEPLVVGVERLHLSSGDFDLEIPDQDLSIHGRSSSVFVDSAAIREDTGGRLLGMERGSVNSAISDELGELGDVLKAGLVSRYLKSLEDPAEITTIGRAVVASKATTHLLVEPSDGSTDNPIEVWISDDSELVQLQYLTTNELGEAVSVELIAGPRPAGLAVIDDDQVVTEEALAEERRAEEEAARDAERAEQEAEQQQMEDAVGDDATLSTPASDEVAAWLSENWSTVVASGEPFARSPSGYACSDSSPRMGLEEYVACVELPAVDALQPTCDAFAAAIAAFSNPARTAWVTAASAVTSAVAEMAFSGDEFVFEVIDGRYLLRSSESTLLLADEAAWLEESARFGLPQLGIGDQVEWHNSLVIKNACGVTVEFPDVLRQELPRDEALLSRIGDDPLFVHLPIERGEQGEHVRQLQEALIAVGISVGAFGPDGEFGDATALAVGQLQYDVGLDPTEVLDAMTLDALRALTNSAGGTADCPSEDDIEQSYLGLTGENVSVTDVRCSVDAGSARSRFAIFSLTRPADPALWVFALEGDVAWNELVSAGSRDELCALVPDVLRAGEFTSDPNAVLVELGC